MLPYRPNSVFPLRGRARLTWQIVRLTAPSFSTFLVLHSAVIIRIPKDSGFQYHINWSKIIKCKLIPCLWVISSSIKELWFMIPTFWGIIPASYHPSIRPLFFLSFFRSNNFRDHYFTSVSWFKGGVAVNWMNRGQNASVVSECRAPAWKCLEVRRRMETRAKIFAL